jgi:chromosome segregation ATPase
VVSSRYAANEAKREAERIAAELQSSKNLSQQEIENLKIKMQTAMNVRQKEMQNIIKAKNSAIAESEKELTAMRSAMGNLSTRIENQNKNLANQLEKINEIQKAKNASNAEKARLKENIEKQLAQLNLASKQIQQITQKKNVLQSQRNNLQKQLTNTQRIVASLQTNLQKSKVSGMWQGAATRGLGTRLRNTQKEVGIARNVISGLRNQRNTLQRATTLNQERAQANITKLQARLGAVRTQKNLLASGLKNAEYRQRLYKLVDVTDNAGALVVRNSRFANGGFKRRSYKNDIMNPITSMTRLREIESEIKAAKAAANKRHTQKTGFNFGNKNTPTAMTRSEMLQSNNRPRANTFMAQTQL